MWLVGLYVFGLGCVVVVLTRLRALADMHTRQVVAWCCVVWLMAIGLYTSYSFVAWIKLIMIWVSMFFAFKSLALLCADPRKTSQLRGWRWWAWLFGWLGMHVDPWIAPSATIEVGAVVRSGALFVALGVAIVVGAALLPFGGSAWVWLAVAWVGFVLALFFGFTRLLVGFWRWRGIHVELLFDQPVYSRSLTEWWGRRWNSAVHHVLSLAIWQRLKKWPIWARLIVVFGASGAVHELLLSYPAGSGWGLPMGYFSIQVVGMRMERWRPLRSRLHGRVAAIWTLVWALLPAPLLFHIPFLKVLFNPWLLQ